MGVVGKRPDVGWRLVGLVPLVVFGVHFHRNWGEGNPGHVLWMCHVSNLALGVGMVLGRPFLFRMAVLWLLPGIPLWMMDMARTGQMPVITFFSHLGGAAVALVAIHRVRGGRWAWLHAWLLYLVCQQVARMVTRPELNVNVAHRIYPGWERWFGAYWQYWIFTTGSAALGLWVLGWVLCRVVPPKEEEGNAKHASRGKG